MVLCDLDKSAESRALINSFTNSGYFTVRYATDDYNAVQGYLDDNKATMALVIPPKFADKILRREQATIQVLLDGSEGNTTAITMDM